MKLYKHQQKFVDENNSKHLLAWGMGSGKTKAVLTDIKVNGEIGHRTLVICPKSLVENWQAEADEVGVKVEILSKEQFRKLYKTLKPYGNILVDEAHFFSGHKSQMFKALLSFVKVYPPNKFFLLTGTPYLSTPFNIMCYGQLFQRGPNWTWYFFKSRFFQDVRMGNRVIPVVRKGIEGDMASLVTVLGSTYTLDELFDVPEQVYQVEYFDLNPDQKRIIKGLEEFLPIVRFTKIHQIENGTLKRDYKEDLEIKCDKTSRVIELCKEHKKIAVVARYNRQLAMYKRLLKEEFPGREIYTINGANNQKQADIDKVNAGDDAIVLINSGASEGYNLWSVPVMVFASMDFSFKNTEQLKGRILRANKLKKNLYISLITRGDSVDRGVYTNYKEKKDFDIEIFAKKHKNK